MARDPNYWPWDTYSPWNTPISSGVQYEATTDPISLQFRTQVDAYPAGINVGQYSVPVYIASYSDPHVTVNDVVHGKSTQIYIPAGASAALGTDANMNIIQPDGRSFDVWLLRWVTVNVTMDCDRYNYTQITSTGFGPQAGIRAAGCSWLGGLVRRWEVEPTDPKYTDGVIRHALAISIPGNFLLYSGGSSGYDANGYGTTLGKVWPATEQDWGSESTYHGKVAMGTLFAIPKSVSIAGLGLNSAQAKLAQAAQDYGCYVVDQSPVTPCWYAEPTIDGTTWGNNIYNGGAGLTAIRQAMVRIKNNTPATIGGGGTPLVALAPQIGDGGTPPPSTRPDSTNTGYLPTAQTLTNYTGTLTFTGTSTLTGQRITGGIVVDGGNLTITKSKIELAASSVNGVRVINNGTLTITDTEIDGTNASATFGGARGIIGSKVTATRVNIHHVETGIAAENNVVIESSYIHDLRYMGTNPFPTAVYHNGGATSLTVRNNSLFADAAPSSVAALYVVGITGPVTGLVVTGNYISGGTANAYIGAYRTGQGDYSITGAVVSGNTFLGDNTAYATYGNRPLYPVDGRTTYTTWASNINASAVAVAQPANTSGGGGGGGGGTTYSTGVATTASGTPLISLGSSSALVATGTYSMCTWYRPSTVSGYHGIMGAFQAAGGFSPGWGVHQVEGGVHNYYYGSAYGNEPAPDTTNFMTANQWVHLGFQVRHTSNTVTLDVVVNGALYATLTDNGQTWVTTSMIPMLGSPSGSGPYATGSFACWRAWNAALTPSDFTAEMNSLTAVKASPIIDLNFTSGSAVNAGSGGSWSVAAGGTWNFSSEGVVPAPNPGTPPPTTFSFSDDFNRTTSTTTLGAPWSITDGGVWGIAGTAGTGNPNKAYAVSASGVPTPKRTIAAIDTTLPNHVISVRVNDASLTDAQGVVVRYTNSSNYVYMTPNVTNQTWDIYKVVAGVSTLVQSLGGLGATPFVGRLTVSATSSLFTFKMAVEGGATNSVTAIITDTILQTGSKAGIRYGNATASNTRTFDDVIITAVAEGAAVITEGQIVSTPILATTLTLPVPVVSGGSGGFRLAAPVLTVPATVRTPALTGGGGGGPGGTPAFLIVQGNPDYLGMSILVTGMNKVGTLTVTRITSSGRTTVRGMSGVSVSAANYSVIDTEMPLDTPVRYELKWVDSGGTYTQLVPSSGDGFTVKDIIGQDHALRDLFLSTSQVATDWIYGPIPSEDINVRGGIFPIIGRQDPIVVVDVKESTSSVLNVITLNRAATDQVKTMLNNANPLLLQVPDAYDVGNDGVLYLQPTKTTMRRPLSDGRRPERVFEISYTQVSPPPASMIFTVAGATYTTVASTYVTYRAMLTNASTGATRTYYDIVYGATFGYT